MIERRQLLTVGGLLGALAPTGGDNGVELAAGQSLSPQAVADMVSALHDLRTAIATNGSFADILPVRQKLTDYLKAQGKFPDFVDVGTDVWFGVHDWHVRMHQDLVFGRDSGGRYTLMLGFTALVLRPEAIPGYISTPYDNR
jgi:hypothetical protein